LPEERRAYWRGRLLERRQLLYLVGCGFLTFGIVHYITHINETPVTHRRRYLAFTKEQFMKLSEFLYTVVMIMLLSSASNSMFLLIAVYVVKALDPIFIWTETHISYWWCHQGQYGISYQKIALMLHEIIINYLVSYVGSDSKF